MARFDFSKYSEKQILAAQLLTDKDTNGFNNARIAEECEIDPRTLYRWLKDEEFLELLDHYAEISMQAFTPELYQQLRKSVRNGSTRGLELALKNRGKLIDRKEVSGNLDVNNSVEGLSHDELRAEIEALKKRVQGIEVE